MPMTDLMALAPPETRKEFDDLFAFAKKEGGVNETMRPHYRQAFANAPFDTRREIDSMIAGAKYAELGTAAAHLVVQDLPGYPKPVVPDDASYPSHWV